MWRRSDGPDLKGAIAREILYQGYAASRQSGFRPYNTARTIRSAATSKYSLSAIGFLMMILFGFMLRFVPTSPLGAQLIYFGVGGLFVSSSALPTAYAVQGSSNVRDFLYLLPLEEEDVRRHVRRAFESLFDYPLLAAVAGSALASAISLEPYPLLGALLGSESAVLVIEAVVIAQSSYSASMAGAVARRSVASLIPLVFTIPMICMSCMSRASAPSALAFLPLVSGAYIFSPAGAVTTALWLGVLGYLARRWMPSAALRILSPGPIAGPSARGALRGWRILRSRTLAILRADLQMSRRSLLASALIGPIVMAGILLAESYQVPRASLGYLITIYGIEMAYLTIITPYSLYAVEVRGASALRSLPITKVDLALPKIAILAIVYYALEGSLMALAWIRGLDPVYLLPFLAGVLGPASSVPAAGIMFEWTLRSGGSLSTLQAMAYLLLVSLLVGLPYGVYYALYAILGEELLGVEWMVAIGAVEFAALMLVLRSYD